MLTTTFCDSVTMLYHGKKCITHGMKATQKERLGEETIHAPA
jgi:hypothetical protein